ncbi:MAG: amino acid--[acyl-carrier-protein] ligase [Acidobacteria bacterium]|nr:amino acid--[acyl-carrier-protein] ligase [Acidobacteriota bacterium]MBV9478750.1 amino acid--[acyl-carrier-protein] ligase [Acidobacteriota bacterium]
MAADALDDVYQRYLSALIDARLLIPSGVRGLYGLGGVFEGVVEHFEAYVTRMGAHLSPEVMRFPPLLSRDTYGKTDHLETFPNLLGSVHSFLGDERHAMELARRKEAGEDWSKELRAAETVLIPAACYPLYPTATGTLPPGGRTVDLRSFVFRHEPSDDPARMQCFRQREYVRLGTPDEALAHRNFWLTRGEEMLHAVGLDAKPVVANDPFFGRGGRVMAATQREQTLKYELVATVANPDKPTAIVSCNYHLDHFGGAFDIRTADGEVAHTACIGFGLERIALALFARHGFEPARWPAPVRAVLEL